MLKECLENVRKNSPLIHNITNYVTVNDCANILLACGASPIMADDINEVEEITSICNGLNINIGTLNLRTINSMHKAGWMANRLSHAVLLDPVGVGASELRTRTAVELVKNIKFDVIRGNISEIKTLANGSGSTRGVDADIRDSITEENLTEYVKFAKQLSKNMDAIIAISGVIDIVADSKDAYVIYNGHKIMSKITGSGCMLSAFTTAYLAANKDNKLMATVAAFCAMGVAGEIAQKRMSELDGNASFRNYLIDAIYNMTGEQLEAMAKYEKR